MSRCIKTGGVLHLPVEHDAHELNTEWLYGDFHLVASAVVCYFPKPRPQEGEFPSHGSLVLPYKRSLYFLRGTSPYHVLVVPASCITWSAEALHPEDELLFAEALEGRFEK